jgi:hypothetical protein
VPQLKPIRGTLLKKPDNSPAGRLAASTVGFWLMNEGTGDTVFDLSGKGHIGTLVNNASWTKGRFGSAVICDGVSDYVDCGDVNAIDGASELTLVIWVKITNLTKDNTLIAKDAFVDTPQLLLWRDESGFNSGRTDTFSIKVSNDANSATIEGATNASSDTDYHQIAVTYLGGDSAGLRLYIDGKEDPNSGVSTVSIATLESNANSLRIGEHISDGIGKGLVGSVDHFVLFNRALSATEIIHLYREPFCMFDVSAKPYFASDQIVNLSGTIASVSSLTATAEVTKKLAGNITGSSAVNGCLTIESEFSPETETIQPTDALFNGMTASAFKLGKALSMGWFWTRTNGCSVLYRGESMEEIDFANILAVTDPDDWEISPPGYIPHSSDTTYFYIVRRFNSYGYEEQTLAAAAKVSIDSNGELAEPKPNKIFDSVCGFVDGDKIRLIWYYCPIRQESAPTRFNIYYDNRTGQVDYQNPIARIDYKGRKFYSFQSGALGAGRYLFAIKAEDTDGIENKSPAQLKIQLNPRVPNSINILSAEAV